MSFRKISILLVLLFGLQLEGKAQKSILKKLSGKWNWIETSGGFAGDIVTPKSEGYSIQMEFTKKGVFKSFKNNVFNLEMTYKLEKGKS